MVGLGADVDSTVVACVVAEDVSAGEGLSLDDEHAVAQIASEHKIMKARIVTPRDSACDTSLPYQWSATSTALALRACPRSCRVLRSSWLVKGGACAIA